MAIKNLEQKAESPETAIRTCMACGNKYDSMARYEQSSHLPSPNSAADYCSDACWSEDSSLYE